VLEKISEFLDKKRYDYEIIVSEDGSTDNTLEIARKFSHTNRRVKIIHSNKRLGKGGGILKGFEESRGDIVAFIDADLSSGPAELEKVVNAVKEGSDVAIASRNMKQSRILKDRPLLRRFVAKGLNIFVNKMFDLSISDTQCGLKAMSKSALEKIMPHMTRKGFEFDVELLLRAKNLGMKIKEVPITWKHMQETSKISGLPIRTAKRVGFGLFDLWIKNSFDRNDLFFFLFLTLFVAFASMFLGANIGADEGTHLTIAAFYSNLFRDYIANPTTSFSKIYNYAISYLVHYPKLSLYYPPGFHSVVALMSYFFGLSSFTGAATALIFATATILLVYYFGRRFVDKKTGIVAAMLFAIIPQIFFSSIKAMLDIPYLLFFMLSLIFYLFAFKSGKTKHFLYAAIFLAIGFFFKQNVIFLAPIVLLYSLAMERKTLKKVLLSFVLAAIIIFPYLLLLYKLGLLSIMAKSSVIWAGYEQGDPQFNSIEGWLYYPQQLSKTYFSYPVFIFSLISFIYYSWKKERHWQLFAIWFATLFLLFVFIPNKEARYMLSAVPALLFPLAFYISKLPKIFSISAILLCAVFIIYTSYITLTPALYYTTDYSEIASTVLQKKGSVLLAADSYSFYSSAFIFEMMKLDSTKSSTIFRPCILDVKNISALVADDGIRYVIVPDKELIPSNNTDVVKSYPSFHPIKTVISKNTTLTIYENVNYVPQKENCNYICITNGWVCSNYSNPVDALR
jgi:hypothetical protein